MADLWKRVSFLRSCSRCEKIPDFVRYNELRNLGPNCPMDFASSELMEVHKITSLLVVKGRHFKVRMATFMRWMGGRVDLS